MFESLFRENINYELKKINEQHQFRNAGYLTPMFCEESVAWLLMGKTLIIKTCYIKTTVCNSIIETAIFRLHTFLYKTKCEYSTL